MKQISRLALGLLFALCASAPFSLAQTEDARRVEQQQQLQSRLKYQEGEIKLRDGLATIQLKNGFRYLDPAGTDALLTGIWGNPSSRGHVLGTIVPADFDPFSPAAWCVVLDFSEDGYVSDSDAEKIDYAHLLGSMKKDTVEANEERRKNGYPPAELVGWAVPPRYDQQTHKFYWAKELKFGEQSGTNTLNYNIRILGRRGVLVLNVIASMDQLSVVQSASPDILEMVNFNAGNTYADYKPGTDKLASYGLAALVAGGIAAKTGVLKWLLASLLAFKKLIPVAAIAIFAFVKRIFGGKPAVDPLEAHQQKPKE
jgi:uncharacterized membrane-anchored protein